MASVIELVKERFKDLTEIQKIGMPRILKGDNVLILAPTGSGKTECALLPVLEKIERGKPGIQALYITPLRALNRDMLKRFNWWCERLEIEHAVRHGDTTQAERAKHRKRPPHMMLITCETLQALLMGKVMREHLKKIKFVIVDEVHDVLDNKRGAQLSMGLERLAEIADFQRIGMSATVANENEAADMIFGSRERFVAEVGKERKMDVSVKYLAKQSDRIEEIKKLVEKNRSLVFVNTRSNAEEIGASLKEKKAPVEIHHGSLSKEVRINAEDKFKEGEIGSLVATSSLELGIDVGDVELAIQYGSPHQVFRLVQRVGRSGHSLDKIPKGIVFPVDFDDNLESEVIKVLADNRWIEDKKMEKGALDVIAHQIVGLCLDKGPMKLKDVHRILGRSKAYDIGFNKLKKVAVQLYAEGIIFYEESEKGDDADIKIRKGGREYYYSNLSTIPKEKRFAMRSVAANKIIASLDEKFVVNLENGASFLAKGQPWMVIDITEKEVLVEPSSALQIAIPEWKGEDIPVDYKVAKGVGKLRKSSRKTEPVPDEEKIVIEIIGDLVIMHGCFGTKVNEGIARIVSRRLSKLLGESVRAYADPYRIMIKLPFPLDEKHIVPAVTEIGDVRKELELSLDDSFLLKLKFIHVGRLIGLLGDDATIGLKFIRTMRHSVVYEEALRAVFFRYFDVERTVEIFEKIKKKEIRIVTDKREEPSFFAKIGIEKYSTKESVGGFEPRKEMIAAFKERSLARTIRIGCLNCGAIRFMHLAGAPDEISCHKCKEQAMTTIEEKEKDPQELVHRSNLIRNYGKKALIALSTYGIGAKTAERVLKKLHRDDETFYWDLIEAQKAFIKNKKYWKV